MRLAGVRAAATSGRMLKPHTPPALHQPFARYSHAVEVPPGHRLLFASGQLGITADRHVPEDAAGQAELCFLAIGEILKSAGMDYSDIVRINAFVTDSRLSEGLYGHAGSLRGLSAASVDPMIVSGFCRRDLQGRGRSGCGESLEDIAMRTLHWHELTWRDFQTGDMSRPSAGS